MTADKYVPLMPPHIRPEFVAWLARRDQKTGLKAFRSGYEHGWHDGQASNRRIA